MFFLLCTSWAKTSDTSLIANTTIFAHCISTNEKFNHCIRDGIIESLGMDVVVPDDIKAIDGSEEFVMLWIDRCAFTYGCLSLKKLASTQAHSDGNEMSAPVTSRVKAEDSFRVQDPALS